MMLQLYDYWRSSAAMRVRIGLNYKNLEYTRVPINLLAAEQSAVAYLEINPQGLVPALVCADEQIIYQSLAIIEFLEENHPEPALLPQGAFSRAYVRGIAQEIACDIHPLNNLRVLTYLRQELALNEEQVNQWYQNWLNRGLLSLEQKIKTSGYYQSGYCYKQQFTLADICVLPQLINARRFKCDLSAFPHLLAIEANCMQLAWVKQAITTQSSTH